MRTAVDDFSSIPAPVVRPVRREARRVAARRTDGTRPAAPLRYERVPAATQVCGPHPVRRVEQARTGLATLATAALLSALAVCGLIGIAQLRGGPTPPAATQTVQVQPGESLSEVAQRVAPDTSVRDTVARIVELNGLRGAEVTAGRTLLVPVAR